MALDISKVQENIRKLRKGLKKIKRRPAPEEIHKLRTRARRFEAAVDALSLSAKPRVQRLLRSLTPIRKKAGRVRDMDVLTAHLSTVRATAEMDCLVQLFEHLGAERYRLTDRLRQTMEKRAPVVRKRLKKLSTTVEQFDRKRASEFEGAVREEAAARALGLLRDLAQPANLDRKNLHAYRLKIKELRYVLQMADDKRQEPLVDFLGQCKDAIGEWHDWEELIAIATDILEPAGSRWLLRILNVESMRKYKAALSITNKMRNSFAGLPGRGKKRNANTGYGLPQRALKAVSRIAA